MATVVTLCQRQDVPEGETLRVCLDGHGPIAVINLDGDFFALADECTHGAGALSDGFVDDDVIVCPLHAGEFHIPTGRALDIPVTEDVKTYTVWLDGDAVMADLDRPATSN